MNNRIKMTDSKFKCNIFLFLSVTVFMARLSTEYDGGGGGTWLGDESRRVQAVEATCEGWAMAWFTVGVRRPVLQASATSQSVRKPVRDREPTTAFQLGQHYYHLSATINLVLIYQQSEREVSI
jgi:hypothetical protein